MTYWGFHARFNLPLLAILLAWNRMFPVTAGEGSATVLILAIVLVFTAPWDNAAARAGIWGFPRSRYWRAIGWLPVEEYIFFLLQSLNVMALCRGLIHAAAFFRTGAQAGLSSRTGVAVGLWLLVWMGAGIGLWRRRPARRWHYAAHLFFWFGPVAVLQWIIATPLLAAQLPLLGLVTLGLGTYYVVADLVAVRHGIWHFDDTQTEGGRIAGLLPWEEAAFFYLTTLLVAQSYLLLLPPAAR